jgi:hypothetical protein
VVSIYLVPDAYELIRPAMERQLEPGSRVVAHDYAIPGWTAERKETMEDESGKHHDVYLYVVGR